MIFLKSPLNYIGGKYKILSQILPLFPQKSDVFLDLFCGGCNVGVNICKIDRNLQKTSYNFDFPQATHIVCNDNLSYLVALYEFLQKENTESILEQMNGNYQKI